MEPGLLFSDGYELKKHRTEISRDIPHEVLFEEILVRLPVKSLAVYKSVCKTWLNTIESRTFREVHRLRRSRDYSDQIMFSKLRDSSDPIARVLSLFPFEPGLIKMISRPLDVMLPPEMAVEPESPWEASFSVLGPTRTTGIYCIIAKHKGSLIPKISICNKLANPFPLEETARLSDRRNWRVHHGFGLAADGDYKVVLVLIWGPMGCAFLSYVYSMKKGVWKKIVDSDNAMVSRLHLRGKPYYPLIADNSRELCPQVFLNGCWHWMAHFRDETCNILSFNVDNEVFKLVLGPPSYRGNRRTEYKSSRRLTSTVVSTLSNHLIFVVHMFPCSRDRRDVISVWMMMEYGDEESWINVWRVNLNLGPVISHMHMLVGISYSLREDGNGSIHIHRIVFQDHYYKLVSCDEFGEVKQGRGFDNSSCIFWNLSL